MIRARSSTYEGPSIPLGYPSLARTSEVISLVFPRACRVMRRTGEKVQYALCGGLPMAGDVTEDSEGHGAGIGSAATCPRRLQETSMIGR